MPTTSFLNDTSHFIAFNTVSRQKKKNLIRCSQQGINSITKNVHSIARNEIRKKNTRAKKEK